MHWINRCLVTAVVCNFCDAFLNIEELKNSKYNLDIVRNPLNELELDGLDGINLASRHGQNYHCTLPEIIDKDPVKEEEKISKTAPIAPLLEPLRGGECLKIIKGWWTYEFCYGKHVKQFHQESDAVKGDITYLGYYESDFDWNKDDYDDSTEFKRHKFNRYHSQSYINGTACDVKQHNRDTEIRYICDETSSESYIERVDEPSICSYILTIRTPFICSHPRTKPQKKQKPQSIVCRPVLSAKEHMQFEEMKIAEENEIKNQMENLKKIKMAKVQNSPFFDFMNLFTPPTKDQKIKSDQDKLDHIEAVKMIERFILPERLLKLKPFQQRRLVMDVADLIKIHKNLPTADLAREIEKYVSRFMSVLEDMAKVDAYTADYQGRLMEGLNSEMLNDLANMKLPGDDDDNEQDVKKKKKPLNVLVKIQQYKGSKEPDDSSDGSLSSPENAADYDPAWRKLEEEVGATLEDAGFVEEDSHIEVRLVTNAESLEEALQLDGDSGEHFRQMLLEIVGGSKTILNEKRRQKSLHDNYNMRWEKQDSKFSLLSEQEKESDDSNDLVKSPQF